MACVTEYTALRSSRSMPYRATCACTVEHSPRGHARVTLGCMKLGAEIRTRRKALGLTLDDLAERSGFSPHYLSTLENEHRDPRQGAPRPTRRAPRPLRRGPTHRPTVRAPTSGGAGGPGGRLAQMLVAAPGRKGRAPGEAGLNGGAPPPADRSALRQESSPLRQGRWQLRPDETMTSQADSGILPRTGEVRACALGQEEIAQLPRVNDRWMHRWTPLPTERGSPRLSEPTSRLRSSTTKSCTAEPFAACSRTRVSPFETSHVSMGRCALAPCSAAS